MKDNIIPSQQQGAQSNTESSRQFANGDEQENFYQQVKHRLLNVNQWHDYAGKLTASFQLTDRHGNDLQRTVQKGDYWKIDIPAPGSVTGEGHDWVRVEAVEEKKENQEEYLAIRVRPCSSPLNANKDIAHFFSDEATSSFIVKKQADMVVAGVYGRNEKPNTKANKLLDKARNTAIATGAVSGFSKLQWKSLVDGLLDIS